MVYNSQMGASNRALKIIEGGECNLPPQRTGLVGRLVTFKFDAFDGLRDLPGLPRTARPSTVLSRCSGNSIERGLQTAL